MIAVHSHETEHPAVSEFFEVFKTPWEPYDPARHADVLICSLDEIPESPARLVVVYGGGPRLVDRQIGCEARQPCTQRMLTYRDHRIPIYGPLVALGPMGEARLRELDADRAVAVEVTSGGRRFVRVGFDLFAEVRHLLTQGQPPTHAAIPTLELHIAFLRDLISENSIPLVEIPPVPPGFNFIACLTHDVDHVGIRNHVFDHTMFGFVYRATIGSMINYFRGRMSASQLLTNSTAALSLPLIHLGLARDCWYTFDRYLELESGRKSTFYFIPRKGDPGRALKGRQRPRRAAHYDVGEIAHHLRRLNDRGCEVAVHGIDAWADSSRGHEELERISGLAGTGGASEVGVRMHWLYFDEDSPVTLEAAGFSYDSTMGYNETVGYRAGTSQVYKPLAAQRLLELPLHIMDTALFYPTYLNLSPRQPSAQVTALLDNAARFGGVVTINWHDRSIAPERLWDSFYAGLIDELTKRGAWFATAAQTVAWFRKRRSASVACTTDGDTVHTKVAFDSADADLPGLRLRVRRPAPPSPERAAQDRDFIEVSLTHSGELRLPLGPSLSAEH